ncbi:hypothetical protein [Streptomyces sp. NPDC018036]|uniref:hypothetical protein n=1 Tax=Streptomyces sp. NPDC018036 TaxID=3365035 RepID=UPI003792DC0E
MTEQDEPAGRTDGDAFILDIGLSWLASKSAYPMWLSAEDSARFVPPDPVAAQLGPVEGAVGTVHRAVALQIGEDARRLLSSALPDDVLCTVWLGATAGYFDPAAHGLSGREWMARIEQTGTTSVRDADAMFVPPAPQPVTDTDLRRRVMDQIGTVADGLERAADERSLPGLVPALEQVVTGACADLGFRLFLRAMKEYFVPIDENRCEAFTALGESFGYPEFLVDDNLNVVVVG